MQNPTKVRFEFVALMAFMMSIVALSIDALLPALPVIGKDLGVVNLSNNQKLVTMIFIGLGSGQLIFGPLSDALGRKPMAYVGFAIFIIASIICTTTKSFEVMIFGRILQGIGLSSPRTMALAMIRDSYSGDYMARIMSFVTMVFILVPVIAPTAGQLILKQFNWQAIFYVNLIFATCVMIWFAIRQPETLKLEHKIPFTLSLFINGTREFFKHKSAVAFTLASGCITGSFMVYLSTSQQVFGEQYQMGEYFPYIFASLAIAVGFSTFLNSQYVVRFGMWKMASTAVVAYTLISALYIVLFYDKNPSLPILLTFLALQFFAIGFIFGNLRALTMEPLGHTAGIGAAINGFISTVIAVPIANYIGTFVNTSVLPLFIGFTIFGLISWGIFIWVKLYNKKSLA